MKYLSIVCLLLAGCSSPRDAVELNTQSIEDTDTMIAYDSGATDVLNCVIERFADEKFDTSQCYIEKRNEFMKQNDIHIEDSLGHSSQSSTRNLSSSDI